MEIALSQILSFFSVALLVLGLNGLRRGGPATPLADEKRGIFGWFAEEIAVLGKLMEPSMHEFFPTSTERLRKALIAAGLDRNISMSELRGLQIGLGGFIFLAIFISI